MDNNLNENENNIQTIKKNEEKTENENVETVVSEEVSEKEETKTPIAENNEQKEEKIEEIKNEEVKNEETHKEDTHKEENTDINNEDKKYTINSSPKSKSKLKKFLIIFLVTLIIAFIVATLSTIFALVNLNNKNILNGISIANVNVSNLSKEEASSKISNAIDQKLLQEFVLYYGDYEVKISPTELGVTFDIENSISEAYNIGRSDNLVKDNYTILKSFLTKQNITPSFTYDEKALNSLFMEMQANIPDHLVEPSYYIEDKNLIITSGEDGIVIQKDSLKEQLINCIKDFSNSNTKIMIPIKDERASNIDIDKIYNEVYKEPVDAYYTTNPVAIYAHKDGVDFEITLEEAKKIVSDNTKTSYTIPLKFTTPKVTISQLGIEAFPDLLSSFTTTYSTANVNRSTNISIAASKINGIVIMPGEIFSYNTTVGKRTAAAGFKEAAIYAGGKVTTDIGGGICQVSSTLYNAALLANLEIIERENHSFNPGYVKAGTDATVSWGYIDFRFKNSRQYPIKVVCSAVNGTVSFKLYGLKEENEYEVVVESTITSYIPYKTVNQNDPTLNVGETKVIESGSSGCRSVTYRVLKQDGKEVSRTLLSQDTYLPHDRVIAVGTKAVQTETKPETKEENKTETQNTNNSNSSSESNDNKPKTEE